MKNVVAVRINMSSVLFVLVSLLSCSSGQQAQDSSLSLVGGQHECEGIVEIVVTSLIEENENTTSSVLIACSREFCDFEAMVLCAQIGCEGGLRVHSAEFNNYSLPTSANNTIGLPYRCSGEEQRFQECEWIGSTCNVLNNNQEDIVAVACDQIDPDSTLAPTTSRTNSVQMDTIFVFIVTFLSLGATSFISQFQ